ncbi:hypothetical protein VPH13_12900 [Stenotrophomonas pavanii]|uniref:hypothetical protein n=1 Tax=Stenotrophomonas pavanii TaxID=487698 RepID=UPI002DBB797E|nr:hypothetical protein [Stenotrophomonas pavanii]MEC4339614.1 hypothetical protein [Stenotrophomonas pavanii]
MSLLMAGELNMSHAELVDRGRRWLRRQGCSVILHEPFRSGVLIEQPDAIGWREGASILLEAKTTRADFLVDAKKPHRADPSRGVGDWRFFIAPAGLLTIEELPDRWGLIEVQGRRTLNSHGVPGNCFWHQHPFPEANKRAEIQLLMSAIARPEFIPRREAKLRPGIDFSAWHNILQEASSA